MEHQARQHQVQTQVDCAERGVKLATDNSKSLTKDSQERSKIYQVVEAERRANPDIEKSTLDSGQMIFYYFIVLLSYIDYLLKT